MYKQAEQVKALRQGKNLAGAVAMDDPQRMRPGAGKATQSTDLIVSGNSRSSRCRGVGCTNAVIVACAVVIAREGLYSVLCAAECRHQ
jgi:hypothetical protein